VSARIRAGSRFKRILCFVLIVVKYFRLPCKMSLSTSGLRVLQVEDHSFRPISERYSVRIYSAIPATLIQVLHGFPRYTKKNVRLMLRHVDSLLGNDHEMMSYTRAVAR
jgi:hypothetical protein